jgi:arylsulfatase A-like enzyme
VFLARDARAQVSAPSGAPNIILITADDLGYGDLGCQGSRIATPNLDRMAGEGVRFEHYYAGSAVSSPSRAALLTGRYPIRTGLTRVLMPTDDIGLPDSETTIARMLKPRGYRTMCIGKWHLGSQTRFLPLNRGFDEFFGIPYSNDMSPLPLLENNEVLEEQVQLETFTQRCTEQALKFIDRAKGSPFFLYFALTNAHIPLRCAERFRRKSKLGPYGDVVQELDWSVGEVLRAIQDAGLDGDTLVIFTSDNGPWYQGGTGRLRGRKGETYEGGMRVPFIARYPGCIPGGLVSRGVGSAIDILPTLARLCGAPLPLNPVDGVDIWPLLTGASEAVERDALLFFDGYDLQCARLGQWKLHVTRYNSIAWTPAPAEGRWNLPLPSAELYNVETDPEEGYDQALYNPEIVADIRARMESLVRTFPEPLPSIWRQTLSIPVHGTPPGALPVRIVG